MRFLREDIGEVSFVHFTSHGQQPFDLSTREKFFGKETRSLKDESYFAVVFLHG